MRTADALAAERAWATIVAVAPERSSIGRAFAKLKTPTS
jgi:hypothetical protein